jgi:hypothetical protein
MRRLAPVLGLLLLVPAAPARADAVTTRIETRPYYGAIVTIEQGVRVWRALPPHDRIIIVPEGAKNVKVHIHAGGEQKAAAPVTMNSNVNINQSQHNDGHGGYGHGGYGHGGDRHGSYRHGSYRAVPSGYAGKPHQPGRMGGFGPGRSH